MTWSPRWASTPGSPSPRCRGSAPAWTRRSPRSAPARLGHTSVPLRLPRRDLPARARSPPGQVVSKAVVVATGITATGGREILGLDVGDSEDETFWRAFLTDLQASGACPGSAWSSPTSTPGWSPPCAAASRARRTNAAGSTSPATCSRWIPKSHKDMVAAVFRTIFAQPDAARGRRDLGRSPRPAGQAVPQDRPADGRGEGRGPGVHRVPQAALDQDLVEQPDGTDQQGDQTPIPGGRDLPQRAPPSSASSAPSWPTPTTNGRSPTAATSPKPPWRCCYPTAILNPPRSPAAREHRGHRPQSPPPAGLNLLLCSPRRRFRPMGHHRLRWVATKIR